MSSPPFLAPDLGAMNRLLPAYEFITSVTSDGRRAVYLVNQKSLDRKAAIKVYSPALSASPEFRESFARTARQMARVQHINLIGVYDSGLVRNMLYLVTEFVPGKPLWNSAKGDAIHMNHVAGLIKGIAEGICHAHRNGVHHGALSLANILLDEQRTPKIGGFSQAGGGGDDEESSLRFRAPELAKPGAVVTAQADIYSMGFILKELATGMDDEEEGGLIKIEGGSRALHQLWLKATAKDPAKRHASAEEFKEELIAALEGKGTKQLAAGAIPGTGRKTTVVAGRAGVARAGAAQSTVTARPMVPPAKPGGSLAFKILIILVLLVAIKVAWGAYQTKKQRQEEERLAKQPITSISRVVRMKRAPEAPPPRERSKPWDPSQVGADPNRTDPSRTKRFEQPREDARELLEPLRQSLLKGSRAFMPKGTVASGDSHFFYVNVPMSWSDAFWFAIDHGGHLAVPDREATAEWMCEKVVPKQEDAFWVGAAKSGRNLWTLADGRPWETSNPMLNKGEFIAIGSDHMMQSYNAAAVMGFVIQWHRDGSNPGSLESLLKGTRDSLTTAAPVYPPGTRAFGTRRYLHVPRPVDWKEAVLTARAGGGHLVVATSIAENFHMEKITRDLDAPDGIWIGGFHLPAKGWRWTTGETWRSTDWPQDKPTEIQDAALALLPGGKWQAMPREGRASGFIIEWSDDADSAGSN